MYCYAYMRQHGDGKPINNEKAIAFYKKAIAKENPYAMFEYGLMLEQGDDSDGTEEKGHELANKQFKEAIKLFKKKSKRKNLKQCIIMPECFNMAI